MGFSEHTKSDTERIRLLIREGEGLAVEFKARYTQRIDEDIVAFANVKGGTLLLGVRDDGTLGKELLTNDLKARINSLARNCKPSIPLKMMQVGEIVVIDVPEGFDKPYACGSGYYRRLDGSTQKLSRDELQIMFTENDPVPFEEKPAKNMSFSDISPAKIQAFADEAGIQIGRTAIPLVLRSLMVAGEFHINNAGALFFAKDVYAQLHQAQTTLIAFKGTDRLHIYDRKDVRDDLLTQFNEAISFLKKHLNIRSEVRGVDREDIYEIPIEVLREAVVNALMHRDYSITGTHVSVEIFDDRVEIVNPGSLPKGLSIHDLGTVSIRRNELIADLFFRTHKVERIGMGIGKMRNIMAAAGLREPIFESGSFFKAVFYRSPELALKQQPSKRIKASEKMSEKASEKMSEKKPGTTAGRILRLLSEQPDTTIAGLSRSIGVTSRTIERNLGVLQKKGMLQRIGPDKGGHWEIPE